MPLQLRRGTTSQRLSITPLVSELVYDTTTKLVYVGDGVTAGGIAIDQDSSPDFPLGDLSDIALEELAEGDILRYDGENWVNSELSLDSLDAVTITEPANNDIIKFNGTNWVNSGLSFSTLPGINLNSPEVNQVLKFNGTSWSNENEDSSLFVPALDDLSNVVLTDVVLDQVLRYDGTNWVNDRRIPELITADVTGNLTGNSVGVHTGPVVGDVVGSVFADNSSLIIDSISGTIYASQLNASGQELTITANSLKFLDLDPAANGKFKLYSYQQQFVSDYFRTDEAADLSVLSNQRNGLIRFGYIDQNGESVTALIQARNDFLQLSTSDINDASSFPLSHNIVLTRTGLVGIGAVPTTDTLEVAGTGKFNGYVQFGSYTDTERNALTPAVGMVIYNTTSNVFQGYQNTGGTTLEWVNLS
jgi:hypothetical protein